MFVSLRLHARLKHNLTPVACVEFGACENATVITSCDEHLAVGQQRRRVRTACRDEAPGGRPSPARRIVEFRARKSAVSARTAGDEHLAIGQQRLRVYRCVRCRGCRWLPRSRSPDRRVPRSQDSRSCCPVRLRSALCRRATMSLRAYGGSCSSPFGWRGSTKLGVSGISCARLLLPSFYIHAPHKQPQHQ